jgi:hypothetical protein
LCSPSSTDPADQLGIAYDYVAAWITLLVPADRVAEALAVLSDLSRGTRPA